MPTIYSIAAAALPMLLYLFLIYKADKYEREPVFLIFTHFIWGAFASVILVFFVNDFLKIVFLKLNFLLPNILQTILFAPVIEEFTKGSFIFFSSKNENFDNLTDALVYGSAIGLGFGMTENALYFIKFGIDFQLWIVIVLMRTSFSAVMHAIATSFYSSFIILSKFSIYQFRTLFYLAGFIIAVTIHFIWNAAVSYEQTFIFAIISLIFFIVSFIILFQLSLNYELNVLSEILAKEVAPETLEKLILFYKKRKSFSNLNKKQISLLIKLGFMLKKIEYVNSSEQNKLMNSIESLRNKILSGL